MLDSNIISKLIISEPGSKEARNTVAAFLKKGYALYTIDLALIETLNVIWKHARLIKDLELEEVNSTIEDLTRIYDGLNVIASRDLAAESMQIALSRNLSIYDALYVAASERMNGTLYTADQKLCTNANEVTNIRVLKPKS
ncbi:MAG: type II toxin-antitoxin system VapC family toxin [Candidatus Bathyarchaeia archaeon]